MKTDLFQSCGHCWVFQICWHIKGSTLSASSFRIWNSSTGILLPPLALFIVILPKVHLTSHSRMSGLRWEITPLWLPVSLSTFGYSSFVYSCHFFFRFTLLVLYCAHLCMKCSLGISNFLEEISAAKSLQSCPTLCDPIDSSPPRSPVPGILQARTLEWVATSFSNALKWKVKVKLLSRVQLFATPWTAAYQAVHGIFQARGLEWGAIAFSKRSLVFAILLPSSISLHWSLRKAFLSLFALLWNSEFRWVYISFSPLPFTSLLIYSKASLDNHFAFLHFFFPWGWSWSLPPVQCHESPFIVQALCLSDITP